MFVSSEEISFIHLRIGYSTNFFSLHRRYCSCDCSPDEKKWKAVQPTPNISMNS